MDDVELEFTDDALKTIAKEAIDRKTCARGLRAIMESIMLDVMYEIPTAKDIAKCIITKEVVKQEQPPILVRDSKKASA